MFSLNSSNISLSILSAPWSFSFFASSMPTSSGSFILPITWSFISLSPSREATIPVRESCPLLILLLTPIGTWHPPSSSLKKALSARHLWLVGLSSKTFIISKTFLSSDLHSMPRAPWPTAWREISLGIIWWILDSKPNLFKPAAARIIQSNSPASNFSILVITFPLISLKTRCGYLFLNCDNPGPKHKARYWACRTW